MKNNDKKRTYTPDFTEENLPKNRREQFFQIIKDNALLLIRISFILFLFFIPIIILILSKNLYLSFIYSNGEYVDEELASLLRISNIIFGAILIPCLMILFIGLSGILKVLRRLIWNEPLFFASDFALGIKENLGQFLLISFIIGALNLICITTYFLLPNNIIYLSYIFYGVTYVVFVPILLITAYLCSIYSTSFSNCFTTAVKIFIRRGIWILLIMLGLYVFYLLSLLRISLAIYLLIISLVFLVFSPIWILLSYINAFSNFDDLINIYYYPDKAYLGLYISKERREILDKKVSEFNENK